MKPNPCKCGNAPIQAENNGVFVIACNECECQCDSFVSMLDATTNWNNYSPVKTDTIKGKAAKP